MDPQNILVKTEGAVGVVTLNRPKALNALNHELLGELCCRAGGLRRRSRRARHRITGSERAFAAGADIKEMASQILHGHVQGQFLRRGLRAHRRHPQADHRRGRRLCAGRRLRTGHDVRLHHRRGHRQVRPARDHAGRHPGHGRQPAPHPLRRQIQGHGHVPDGPDDGRRGGRTRRARRPGRAGRRSDGRDHESGGQDRRTVRFPS